MQRKLDINVEKEIYLKKKDGMRTKDILAEYGINKKLLSRIMHRNSDIEKGDSDTKNGDNDMNSDIEKGDSDSDSDIKGNSEKGDSDIKNGDNDMNSDIEKGDSDSDSDSDNKGDIEKGDSDNNRDMLISNLFENIAELCNVVLKQQKRIDTLQQRVESLQTRLESQMGINHQTEEKTQPETKSDNVGWDEWEPTQIIHTNNGTEIIRDGKKYTRDEFLSQFTDEEINLYKNLFIMDDDDDNNNNNEPSTNEQQKPETHEPESKFDVDEDGFCALKPKKW